MMSPSGCDHLAGMDGAAGAPGLGHHASTNELPDWLISSAVAGLIATTVPIGGSCACWTRQAATLPTGVAQPARRSRPRRRRRGRGVAARGQLWIWLMTYLFGGSRNAVPNLSI